MITSKRYDLSIIIPCHNIEGYIGKCLDSILNQNTTVDYEIVCICDRCTDRTKEVIQEKLKGRQDIVIDADVGSCGSARNIGLQFAKGELIWFIDGDDWITTDDAIETLVNEMDDNTDILIFGYESAGYKHLCYEMVWQYMYRRSIIQDAKFRAMQPSEDYVFQRDIFSRHPRVKQVPRTFYYYNYPRVGSVMWKALRGMTEENIEAR
jgi:glycosyltransferase involved in cell wall biosynthesis